MKNKKKNQGVVLAEDTKRNFQEAGLKTGKIIQHREKESINDLVHMKKRKEEIHMKRKKTIAKNKGETQTLH